ncbi:hypothetical protein PG991_007726 [Apiospora marii]|uniref:Nephrocystin 3-like N-terminal domain-containing protein n=1 Tax=Apiospora marii TaxID=335849 RepID=A0ABR1RU99_9PEZI
MGLFGRSQQAASSKERVSIFRRLRSKISNSRHDDDDGKTAASGSTPTCSALSPDVGDETLTSARDETDKDASLEETGTVELAAVNLESASELVIIDAPCSRPPTPQGKEELGLWSAAYREAVASQNTVDQTILRVESIQELFAQLEATESGSPDDSLFRKGLKQLEKLKGPLQQMKLVLDVTSPLASAEPAAATVISVVQGVTALAISLATARETLTSNIGEMLEQMQVIDECDSVAQQMRDDRKAIHVALVNVYSTMLQFYGVAYELLHMSTGRMTFKLVRDDTKLPGIISRFIVLTGILKDRIDMATIKMVEEIHTSIISNEVKQWLGFDKILSRDRFHTGAEGVRNDDACEWLLQDQTFRKWYTDRGSAQLVLVGEMGCGKTVLTTFVTKKMLLRGDHQIPRSLVCYHYCRDDESGNAVYIAQSLVLQLIHQHAKPLEKQFHDWYKATYTHNKPVPTTDLDALLGYFYESVKEIGENREVVVILDGLDECDAKIASFVDKFRKLSDEVPHFKVMYSTRPHTRILNLLSHAPQLSINSKLNRSRDETLARHLVKKLEPKLGDEQEGKELMDLLVAHLAQSAQGSAIWIRVMVDLVNDQDIVDIVQCQQPATPEAKLTTFPIKLIATASRALEILAVSRRPLSIDELAYAVALTGFEEPPTSLPTIEAKLARNRLKQLIEPFVTQYKPEEPTLPQIKLLHRSLQEFILRHSPSDWTNVHLQTPLLEYESTGVMQRRRESMERHMFQLCATYLLLDEIGNHSLLSQDEVGFNAISGISDDLFGTDSFTNESAKFSEVRPDRDATFDPVALSMGPFFVYAACYWLEYLSKLVDPTPEMVEQIIRLMEPGSARLRNWGDQYCRPECTFATKFEFAAEQLDPLSIVAFHGSDDIFRAMLTQAERFAGPEFQPTENFVNKRMLGSDDSQTTTVFRTAMMKFVRGDATRLRVLFLDDRTGPDLRVFGFFRGLINAWRRFDRAETPDRRWSDLFDLVQYASGDMVRDAWANWLLCEAARSGCIGVMQRLFDEASHNDALRSQLLVDAKRDGDYKDSEIFWQIHQSVGEAVLSNSVEAVRFLLDQPGIAPHFRHRNHRNYTVFFMVASHRNPVILELLLSRLPSLCDGDDTEAARLINQVNNAGDTALNQIVFSPRGSVERLRCIELLLASGADPNLPHDPIDSRPLAQAAVRGDLDLIRLLVRCGGDAVDPGSLLVPAGDGGDEGRTRKMTLKFPMLEQEEMLPQVVDLLTELLAARRDGNPGTLG